MVWWVKAAGEYSHDQQAAAVAAIDRCLKSTWRKGYAIKKVLAAVALDHDEFGGAYLHLEQVLHAAGLLAKALDVPPWIFDGMEERHDLFDFNGNGHVDEREAARIYKAWLKQKRIELGGRPPVEVPFQTVESSGYVVEKELGRGGQGAMYLCTKRSWLIPRKYCIKFYDKAGSTATGLGELLDEYETMLGFNNEHVAKTYEVFQDETHFYLVNEVYTGGDLTKLAKNAYDHKVRMSENWWRAIFRQCLQGLDYLHEHGIVHCDIKEPNIMVYDTNFQRPRPVIIDFGLAESAIGARQGVCGTPGYIPPETYQSGMWYPRGDIFSFGITFFQMMSGLVPSKGGTVQGVLQVPGESDALARAAESKPLPFDQFPRNMPGLASLVEWMTERDACKRPRSAQVGHHPWFQSNNNADLPPNILRRLISTGAGHTKHEALTAQLHDANTLDDLRVVQSKFQMADKTGDGTVDMRTATKILTEHGVDPELVKASAARTSGGFNYEALTEAALVEKEGHNFHFLKNLFAKLDTDKSGYLTLEELKKLANHGVFDCPDVHVEQLLAWMDKDGDGVVSLTEFTQAALEYGRIKSRSQVKGSQAWMPWTQGPSSQAPPASAGPPPSMGPPQSMGPAQSMGPPQSMGALSMPPQAPMMSQAVQGPIASQGLVPLNSMDVQGMPLESYAEEAELVPGAPGPWRIAVTLMGARGLRFRYPGAPAHCRCVCTVQGEHPLTFQTDVAWGSGNPSWNFEQEIVGFVPGDALEFAVVEEAGHGVEVLGTAVLYWDHFFPVGYNSPLTICSPGAGIQGVLNVQVHILGEENALRSPLQSNRQSLDASVRWADQMNAPLVDAYAPPPHPLSMTTSSFAPSPMSELGHAGDAHITWGRTWQEERRPPAAPPPMAMAMPLSLPAPLVPPRSAPLQAPLPLLPATAVPMSASLPAQLPAAAAFQAQLPAAAVPVPMPCISNFVPVPATGAMPLPVHSNLPPPSSGALLPPSGRSFGAGSFVQPLPIIRA